MLDQQLHQGPVQLQLQEQAGALDAWSSSLPVIRPAHTLTSTVCKPGVLIGSHLSNTCCGCTLTRLRTVSAPGERSAAGWRQQSASEDDVRDALVESHCVGKPPRVPCCIDACPTYRILVLELSPPGCQDNSDCPGLLYAQYEDTNAGTSLSLCKWKVDERGKAAIVLRFLQERS